MNIEMLLLVLIVMVLSMTLILDESV
jgi:hypothetical protein